MVTWRVVNCDPDLQRTRDAGRIINCLISACKGNLVYEGDNTMKELAAVREKALAAGTALCWLTVRMADINADLQRPRTRQVSRELYKWDDDRC